MAKRKFRRKRRTKKRGKRSLTTKIQRQIFKTEEHKSYNSQVNLNYDYLTSNVTGFMDASFIAGTGRNQRLGTRIMIHQLWINLIMAAGSVGGAGIIGQPCRVRYILCIDKQTTGAAAVVGAVPNIGNVVTDPVASRSYYSMLNPSVVPTRLRVLRDKFFNLDISGGVTDQAVRRSWKVRIRFKKPLVVTFVDDPAQLGVAAIQKNSLIMYTISDQTALTVPNGALEWRFVFTDA